MNEHERPTLLHCVRCGVPILHNPDHEVRFDHLCPRCTEYAQWVQSFVLCACTTIVALIVIGVLLHVLFPHPR